MMRLLLSVTDVEEAHLASMADVLDLKNPAQGALGALPVETLQAVRQALPQKTLSATIGDLPLVPEAVQQAVQKVAATGVDYVKIGLFAGDLFATLRALVPLARQTRLVGVIFADRPVDLSILQALAEAGFAGAMLDTAGKTQGALTALRPLDWLKEFVARARGLGLLVGLAGSLRLDDVSLLQPLRPDYLGFRGAACQHGQRTKSLDPQRVYQLYQAVHGPLPAHSPAAVSARP
ncbi:(5-formylfuran-3-yl)methyl phosphate synthase [Methylothermus subterraneus]